MKTGTIKPHQEDVKPALPTLQPAKSAAKRPDSLPIHPVLDAWLTTPPQPESLLHLLRNRSN